MFTEMDESYYQLIAIIEGCVYKWKENMQVYKEVIKPINQND